MTWVTQKMYEEAKEIVELYEAEQERQRELRLEESEYIHDFMFTASDLEDVYEEIKEEYESSN